MSAQVAANFSELTYFSLIFKYMDYGLDYLDVVNASIAVLSILFTGEGRGRS